MTDQQITEIYLIGAVTQLLFVLYKLATKKNEDGRLMITTHNEEAGKVGVPPFILWPMFVFYAVMSIAFWPLSITSKVLSIAKKGIWN